MCIVLPNYSFSRILAHIVWFDQDSRDFFVKHYTVKRKAEITVNIHSSRLWNSRYIQAKVYVYHPNFRVCAQRKVPVKRFKISHYTKIQSCFKYFIFSPKWMAQQGIKYDRFKFWFDISLNTNPEIERTILFLINVPGYVR